MVERQIKEKKNQNNPTSPIKCIIDGQPAFAV